MPRLNIRIITPAYPDSIWRVKYIFTHELARALVSSGHFVEIYDLNADSDLFQKPTWETFEGVNVLRIPENKSLVCIPFINLFSSLLKFFRFKKNLSINSANDYVYIYSFLNLYSLLGVLFNNKKSFLIVHGTDALNLHFSKLRFFYRIALKRFVKIFAVSDFTATIVMLSCPNLCDKKLFVLPNGVDKKKLNLVADISKENARAELELEKKYYLLCVSDLVKRKGIDLVIKALPYLPEYKNNLELIIIGSGPEAKNLFALSASLGVGNQVRFIDYVHDDYKLSLYYKACDIYTMISKNVVEPYGVEGFGISYAEAAYIGRPVIAGRSGGVPLPVVNHLTGYLVDTNSSRCSEIVAQKIKLLFENKALYNKMSACAADYARSNFDWSLYAEKLLECLVEN